MGRSAKTTKKSKNEENTRSNHKKYECVYSLSGNIDTLRGYFCRSKCLIFEHDNKIKIGILAQDKAHKKH